MIWEYILRLFVACLLGSVVGLDREYRAKEAGYRTHFLVALGSALLMIISQYAFLEIHRKEGVDFDPSRVAAQVVSGIGFIGAGTIIFQKQVVRGLTTAAGIWATSAVGMAVGAGMYGLGIAATVLTLIGLEGLNFIFKSAGLKSTYIEFTTDNKESLHHLINQLNRVGYRITSYTLEEKSKTADGLYYVTMVIKSRKKEEESALLNLFQGYRDITVQRIE